MTPSLVFNANDIPPEGIAVDVELPPAWLDVALANTEVSARRRSDGGGRVAGRLSRSGNDIVVRTRVRARVALPCARCLEAAPLDVDADLSLLLQPAPRNDPRVARASGRGARSPSKRRSDPGVEHEISPAEAETDVYDGETVVLDDFVREAILLEVPSFPLCRESCRGIAPSDERRPEPEAPAPDPRLAALGAFRQRPPDAPVTVEELMAAAQARGQTQGRKPRLRTNQAAPRKRRRP